MNRNFFFNAGLALIVIIMTCHYAKSQNLDVTYNESLKFNFNGHEDDPDMQRLKNAANQTKTLTCSDGKSIYREINYQTGTNEEMGLYILSGEISVNIYKNQNSKEIIKELDLYTRHFIIRTEGNGLQWKIEPEQKKIGDYMCQKAVCNIDTVPVKAWYCPQIPVSDGPDIFWGLPGLILEVTIGNDTKTILVSKIEFKEKNSQITPPDKGKKVSEAEYNEIKRMKIKEMRVNGGKIQHSQKLKVD